MFSAKRHSLGRNREWISPNPIVMEFRDRILLHLGMGLNKIWFQLGGDAELELAGALGYLAEDYANVLRYGGFTTTDYKLQVQKLQQLIAVTCAYQESSVCITFQYE